MNKFNKRDRLNFFAVSDKHNNEKFRKEGLDMNGNLIISTEDPELGQKYHFRQHKDGRWYGQESLLGGGYIERVDEDDPQYKKNIARQCKKVGVKNEGVIRMNRNQFKGLVAECVKRALNEAVGNKNYQIIYDYWDEGFDEGMDNFSSSAEAYKYALSTIKERELNPQKDGFFIFDKVKNKIGRQWGFCGHITQF